MPSVVPSAILNEKLLDRLDEEIKRYQLHEGDCCEPVDPYALLENINYWYGLVAVAVLALLQRWRKYGHRFSEIMLQEKLKEPEWTAENRRALIHEWAHLFCRHRGVYFVLWRDGMGPDRFGQWVDNRQERQCDLVAAYVLVRRDGLFALREYPDHEVARLLDVPVKLVQMRWQIWSKYSR